MKELILELSTEVREESSRLFVDVKVPPRIRAEWLLNLYILYHEQEPFSVVLRGVVPIMTRIILRREEGPPRNADWRGDKLVLTLDRDDLENWITTFRRWYQGKWDTSTERYVSTRFSASETNLETSLWLILGPGTERDPAREPRSHRRNRK